MSESAVTVGELSCYVIIDRRTTTGWSPEPQRGDGCLAIINTVRRGKTYSFDFFAPSSPGTFRLRTYINEDSLISGSFVVQ